MVMDHLLFPERPEGDNYKSAEVEDLEETLHV